LELLRSAGAEFKDGMLTGWTASQAMHHVRTPLAPMLAMPNADVRRVRPVREHWMRADAQRHYRADDHHSDRRHS
jgi:CO/xanthine dehydrogenase Mo-binding subunit